MMWGWYKSSATQPGVKIEEAPNCARLSPLSLTHNKKQRASTFYLEPNTLVALVQEAYLRTLEG
jgi:hypothetical protein